MGRKPVVGLVVGAVLLIGAVAGFVVLSDHRPRVVNDGSVPGWGGTDLLSHTVGWSRTLYDVLQIATWALLIVGVLLVAVGLINYARHS